MIAINTSTAAKNKLEQNRENVQHQKKKRTKK